MPKTKVVLHWVESDQSGVEDLSILNDEDRYVGAKCSVKVGNKFHRCIVRLISSDPLKISAEESKLCDEIEKRLNTQRTADGGKKQSRSQRHRRGAQPGVASSNQVAAGLGERLKPLTAEQERKAKEAAASKKAAEAAQRSAQDEIDRQVLKYANNNNDDSDIAEASASEGESDCNENVQEDEEDDKDASENNQSGSVEKSTERTECCKHCLDLQLAYKESPQFARALSRLVDFAQGTESSPSMEYLEILPVPDGVPKTELSKGSKVFLRNADKNSIKADAGGDPAKLVRLSLIHLYGKHNLEATDITAKGQRKGSKSLRPSVLKAIKDFANRNRNEKDFLDAMTDSKMNKIINRKKTQLHRLKSNKHSNVTIQKGSKSPRKSSKKVSPTKSPMGKHDLGCHLRSPLKSPRKSPGHSKSPHYSLRQNGTPTKSPVANSRGGPDAYSRNLFGPSPSQQCQQSWSSHATQWPPAAYNNFSQNTEVPSQGNQYSSEQSYHQYPCQPAQQQNWYSDFSSLMPL